MANDDKFQKVKESDDSRYNAMPMYLKVTFLALTIAGVIMSIFFIFSIRVKGVVMNELTYYYLFLGAFIPGCFFYSSRP